MRAFILAMLLVGCASQQQRLVNEAYVSQQQSADRARQESVKACAQSAQVAECMLGVGLAFASSTSASALPVVSSDAQGFAQVLGAVAPVAGAVIQAAYSRDVAINASNNATAQQSAQWTGITAISNASAQAQSATASAAISGMGALGAAGFGAVERASAGASQSLGLGFNQLPNLLPSITAGGDVVQGDGNDSSVRRDTFTGDGIRISSPGPFDITTSYELVCTAAPAGNGANGGAGANSTGGTGGSQTQTCQLVPRG